MLLRPRLTLVALLITFLQSLSGIGAAQTSALCNPSLGPPVVVASSAQRLAAGAKAEPPLTDGFDWPDTPLGIIKAAGGYKFFGSDGGAHNRQMWHGRWVGNDKSGSITTTMGSLDNPLGTANPRDVSISPNRDPSVNPIYPSYGYMGGGPALSGLEGMTGAGKLLAITITANFRAMRSMRLWVWLLH